MLQKFAKKQLLLLIKIALTAAILDGASASAATILDTGYVTFSPTGTQFGRITRDGNASVWGAVKTFPGVTGAPTARAFEAFDILDTGNTQFIQISLDDPTASVFMAAYLNSFSPVNTAPNFGLNLNYLGDPGLSQPFDNPSFFQIVVAPHSHLVIPINEINPGGGAGKEFDLLVEGFYDSSYSDTPPVQTPESSELVLCGVGVLAVGLRRAFAQTRKVSVFR